jgi:hypothetical protein
MSSVSVESNGMKNLDYNYILYNRSLKYIINFLIIYFICDTIFRIDHIEVHQLALIICTLSSVLLYILDTLFPSCSV